MSVTLHWKDYATKSVSLTLHGGTEITATNTTPYFRPQLNRQDDKPSHIDVPYTLVQVQKTRYAT